MGTSSSLAEAGAKLDRILSPATVQAMSRKAGEAAKKAGLAAAAASLGGDHKMSGLRGPALSVDVAVSGSGAVVSYRGPWGLAQSGRKRRQVVRGRIFNIPGIGPRWSFRSGPSRGLGTLTAAQRGATLTAGRAADEALQDAIGKVF